MATGMAIWETRSARPRSGRMSGRSGADVFGRVLLAVDRPGLSMNNGDAIGMTACRVGCEDGDESLVASVR